MTSGDQSQDQRPPGEPTSEELSQQSELKAPFVAMRARLKAVLGDDVVLSLSGGGQWARVCVDVPRERWRATVQAVRDDLELRLTFFDWLSGIDRAGEEQSSAAQADKADESAASEATESTLAGFSIVAHLWSVAKRHGVLLRTAVPADDPRLDSVVSVFPGAAWHERETFEMFGVTFDGHPDLRKLLLADEFEGHPLRKDFVLASRVVKDWPGSVEPGQSDSGSTRKRMLPPGVPQPGEWGGR